MVALVGGVYGGTGIRGVCLFVGIGWWCLWWWLLVCKTCLPKENKVKVDQRLTTQKKATVQRDSKELSEQSQSGKSEAEERYENNVEEGGQRSVDSNEENESEKEEELKSQKQKEDDHRHDNNGSPTGRE
ncbi:hypothetical protein P3L10_023932 [Capsicum annuum]